MNRGLLVLLATTALVPTASAAARGWSSPAVLESPCGAQPYSCVTEPAPRVAVNARGRTAVAWVDAHLRVRVATAGARGRFGRPVTLGSGLRPGVAIAADGTVVVMWSNRGVLRYARRVRGHRFSRPARLAPPRSYLGDDSPKLAAQPDGSTLVVYENRYRRRLLALVLSPGGHPGPSRVIGEGSYGRDSFRAAADGQVAVCCLATPGTDVRNAVAAYAPGRGWSTLIVPVGSSEVIETVGAGRRDVALGTVDVRHSGDAGTLGLPGLLRADGNGVFGERFSAPVVRAGRALGPVVAIDGSGRNVLVYQEKRTPSAFSRSAPVYAVIGPAAGAFGRRQVLDRHRAYQPAVRAYRRGAIAAWEAPGHRWRVSVECGGTFVAAPAPTGGPSIAGEDFNYNRDMGTGGRYVVLAWTASDGSVRASVGVL